MKVLILLFFIMGSTWANLFFMQNKDANLIKIQNSVVDIEITHNDETLGFGTGILYKEYVLVNKHLLKYFINNKNSKIRILAKNKNTAQKVEIGPCGEEGGIDLCLMKTDLIPSYKFSLGTGSIGKGKVVYSVGYCNSEAFSIEENTIVDFVKDFRSISSIKYNSNISMILSTSKNCNKGSSGSALVDFTGELIGIISGGIYDKKGLNNYSISSNEIRKFIANNRSNKFKSIDKDRILSSDKDSNDYFSF